MELSEVLTIHKSIKEMDGDTILKIMSYFRAFQLKQLLSIYLQYFFIKNKRDNLSVYDNIKIKKSNEKSNDMDHGENDSSNNNQGHIDILIIKQLKTNIMKFKILNKKNRNNNNMTIFHKKTNSDISNCDSNCNSIHSIHSIHSISKSNEDISFSNSNSSHNHNYNNDVIECDERKISHHDNDNHSTYSNHSSYSNHSNHSAQRQIIGGDCDSINEITANSCMANLFDIDGYAENNMIIDNVLPQVLLSYIMSFMDHKTRLIASKVNHLFFQASTQSISKYHLLINSNVVSNKLIYNPDNINLFKYYKSISWWSSYKFQTETNVKWQNFKQNMIKLLTNDNLEQLNIVTLPVYRDCSEELEDVAFTNDNIKNLKILRKCSDVEFLHTLEKLEITRCDMEPLWINQTNDNSDNNNNNNNNNYINDERDSSFYDTAILINNYQERPRRLSNNNNNRNMSKYFITKSNIKHLVLKEHWFKETEGTEFKSFFHPIFWLWNLPSLEECQLTVILNPTSQFQQHYSKMLSSSSIKEVAKKQKSFYKLIIDLKYVNQEDVAVFCEYLRVLYPNLLSLSILLSNVVRAKPIDIKYSLCFKNLREIRLNLATTKDGQNFLQEIINCSMNEFDGLQVLHLNEMKPSTAIYQDRYTYITQEINDLLLVICQFLKKRPKYLHSFGINILRIAQHQSLSKTYWKPILILLQSLLSSIKEKNDIFDGYLSLSIPFCGFLNQKNIRTDHDRHWWTGEYSWDKKNNQGSLDIAHTICELQTEITNRNKIHDNNKRKLILDLNKLILRKKHDKFLKFWFNDDNELYDGRKFIMQ